MARVEKINGRKYYIYVDTNGVEVTVPNWYRWINSAAMFIVAIVYFFLGYWIGVK